MSSSIQPFIIKPFRVQRNVVAQGIRKQEDVLEHDSNVLTQCLQWVGFNGLSINQDTPLLVHIESVEQIDDGRLACSGGTYKRYRLTWFNSKGYVLQHPFLIGVSEPNVLEFNRPSKFDWLK